MCDPLIEGWEVLMTTNYNLSIKIPVFKLEGKYYGTDSLFIFEIELGDFTEPNNLVYHDHSDSFSYLYIHQGKLITYSHVTTDIICLQSNEEILLGNHMNKLANQILFNLNFFKGLYTIKNKRIKRSNMINTWVSSLFFTDSEDLTTIHKQFYDFLEISNHNILIEKGLIKIIEANEKQLFTEVYKLEINQWFNKFLNLKIQRKESVNTEMLLYIDLLRNLDQELMEFKNIINWILLQNKNKVNCLPTFGCFHNSQIVVENNNLTIQLERLQWTPELATFQTCTFFNKSHVYVNHHKLNVPKDKCNITRPIEQTDYFYNSEIILILNKGLLAFSCASNLTLYVNNKSFLCTKIPRKFFKSIFSFKLKETHNNFIVKNIDKLSLTLDDQDVKFDVSFSTHLDFKTIQDNTTYFNGFLPKVIISPTLLGSLLIGLLILIMIVIMLIALYCCNAGIRTFIDIYFCCQKNKKTVIQIVDSNKVETLKARLEEDSASLQSLSTMTPFK